MSKKMAVKAVGLAKSFGEFAAVKNLDVTIEKGEFFTLLGPSGCGKTTTLFMIAGLYDPDRGEITINDRIVFSRSQGINVPAEKRGIGMVFQSYAIWPHYTVFENIAYPLKIRKFPKSEIRDKVAAVLSLVKMDNLGDRYPGELSGGQQQRVALARALVYSPSLLLLDEPLANLDYKVREVVRFELKELQRRTKVTTIYVTHDQTEAMVLSDRIAVLEKGELAQEGTPSEIYLKPKSKFVADFIGLSNFIPGVVNRVEEDYQIVKMEKGGEIRFSGINYHRLTPGKKVLLCLRPEDFELHTERPETGLNVWEAKIRESAFLGNIVTYWVEMAGQVLRVQSHPYFDVERKGDKIFLSIREKQIKIIELP